MPMATRAASLSTQHPSAEPSRAAASDSISRLLGAVLDEAAPAPVLSPVLLATASSEVADRLITAVAMGEFLPGDRLPPERELARIMAVSRTGIREALARLEAIGITETRRGRAGGAYVRSNWTEASADAVRHTLLPRWGEFEQLLDLRGLVEEIVGRAAAERRTDEQLKDIRAAFELYRQAATLHEEQVADSAFHRAILVATNNPQLYQLSRTLLARSSLAFPFEPWGTDQGPDRADFLEALADHEAILDALSAGDVELTGSLSRQHFGITVETFRAVVDRVQLT